MNNSSFTTAISVDNTPEEVFNAINNVRGWWSEQIDGSTDKLNEVFRYHFKDVHLCRMKLIEVVPAQKVVWEVLDNYFNFIEDQQEWQGSRVSFEISRKDDRTHLVFTHIGLTPKDECYKICADAWGNYIRNSLRSLIETGKGQPNPKDGTSFNTSLLEKWKLGKSNV